jgi:hypothetical protein
MRFLCICSGVSSDDSKVGTSVVQLLHFVSSILTQLIPRASNLSTALPCNMHILFDLPHLPHCANSSVGVSLDVSRIYDAVAAYVFSRFSALVASTFHVINRHFRTDEHSPFANFFFGPFPRLLDAHVAASSSPSTPVKSAQKLDESEVLRSTLMVITRVRDPLS